MTDHGQYELLSASLPAENSGQAGGWSSITFYYVIQLPGARDVSQPRGHGGGPTLKKNILNYDIYIYLKTSIGIIKFNKSG